MSWLGRLPWLAEEAKLPSCGSDGKWLSCPPRAALDGVASPERVRAGCPGRSRRGAPGGLLAAFQVEFYPLANLDLHKCQLPDLLAVQAF